MVEDATEIAASIGVPGATEAEIAIVLLSTLAVLLYPFWVPPWDPAYVPPNANQDALVRPGR